VAIQWHRLMHLLRIFRINDDKVSEGASGYLFNLQQRSNQVNEPLCILSIGWRCIAAAAGSEEFKPLDMASAGLRITGMELLMLSGDYFRSMDDREPRDISKMCLECHRKRYVEKLNMYYSTIGIR